MYNSLIRLRRCFQPRQWFASESDPVPSIIADEDTFMWVYREDNKEGSYQVGYFTPDGVWFCEGVYGSKELASARTHYLNGGRAGEA